MFINSERILCELGKEPPLMTTREELKAYTIIDAWKKLITQGQKKNKPAREGS